MIAKTYFIDENNWVDQAYKWAGFICLSLTVKWSFESSSHSFNEFVTHFFTIGFGRILFIFLWTFPFHWMFFIVIFLLRKHYIYIKSRCPETAQVPILDKKYGRNEKAFMDHYLITVNHPIDDHEVSYSIDSDLFNALNIGDLVHVNYRLGVTSILYITIPLSNVPNTEEFI